MADPSHFSAFVLAEARKSVRILENGRPRKLTAQQAVLRRLFILAMTGDARAARILVELVRTAEKEANVEQAQSVYSSKSRPEATTAAEAVAMYQEMIAGRRR